MKLFSSSSKASRAREERPAASKASKEDSVGVSDSIYSDEESASSEEEEEYEGNESANNKGTPKGEDSLSFESLGLSEWVCKSVSAMGFRQPTPVQQKCVPAILSGHDVIGCAETGSGKTAAFALPILNHLSKDPYGIFAVILTPTRELGAQISEQFVAFGAPIGLRVALIIGGVNMTEQSLNLKRLPHIVIATPGRLRAHLEGPDPPNLSRTPYLVLDEADRLLSQGFSSELRVILTAMSSKKRKTFLFSATMTDSLTEVEKLAMSQTLRFDLTAERRVPSQLVQEYLFMPSQVKMNYLVAVLDKAVKRVRGGGDGKDDADNDVGLGSHDYKKGGKKGAVLERSTTGGKAVGMQPSRGCWGGMVMMTAKVPVTLAVAS
jgi:ATP-dependent RNA helicase DDX49/DBP8